MISNSSAPVIICLAVSTATFGIGPFTQQSIRSMPCDDVVLSVGEIPLSNFVTAPNYDDPPDPSLPVHYGSVKRLFDYDMTYMIRQGFTLNTANVPTVGTHARCTTGNCTFPEYSSLAICSRCFDVSSDIRTKGHVDRTAVYLPNGCTVRSYLSDQPYGKEYNDVRIVWLQARWLQMLYDGEGRDRNIDEWPFSVADDDFKRIARNMLPITILGLGGDGKVEDASAAVCALYPCIQTYSGAFEDDKFDEVVTSEVPLETDHWGAAYAVLSPCNIDGHAYSFENNFTVPGHQPGPARTASLNVTGKPWSVPVECLYYATKDFMLSWSDYIATTFRTNCTMILHEAKSHVCDTFGFEALVNNGNASFDVYSKVMDNIAKATTTQLRISDINAAPVDFYYPDAFNGSIIRNVSLVQRGSVGGVGSRTTVCYEMQWQWLAFPAGMVAAVLLLVLWAIQSTFARRLAGRPVWKSSVLPLVFHGLLPSGSSGNGGSAGWGAGPGQRSARELETTALQEKASRVVVQLVNGKEGCGFMVVNGPDRWAAEEDAQQEWQDEQNNLDRASIDTDRWVTGIQGLRARPDGRS